MIPWKELKEFGIQLISAWIIFAVVILFSAPLWLLLWWIVK